MDDIKRIKKKSTPASRNAHKEKSAAAIEDMWKDQSVIEQPKKLSMWAWAVVGVIAVAVGVAYTSYKAYRSDPPTHEASTYSEASADKLDGRGRIYMTDKTDKIDRTDNAEEGVFDSEVFYGVGTADGTLYFGRIVESGEGFYRLESVFYDEGVDKGDPADLIDKGDMVDKTDKADTADRSGTITLVKFGTEDYQPEDELTLPREQVKQIFKLSDDSPILKAIRGYLGDRGD